MPVVMTSKPMVSGIDVGSVFRADEPTSKRRSPSLALGVYQRFVEGF